MTQNFLLLRTCRRPMLYAAMLGIALPIGILIVALLDGESKIPGIARWFSHHAFAVTVYAAGIAAFSHLIAGLPSALEKLPVPTTAFQRAYLPLGFALLHWIVLLGIVAVILVLGGNPSLTEHALRVLSGTASGLPLGLFIIAVANRNAGNTNVLPIMGMPFYTIQLVFTDPQSGSLSSFAMLSDLYSICWPAIVPGALLIIWETPRHRENWRRATFIQFPNPVRQMAIREPLAPQRVKLLTLTADLLTLVAMLTAGLPFVSSFAVPLLNGRFVSSRPPLWVEQAVIAGLLALIIFSLLAFFVVQGLLLLQSGQWQQDRTWAQRFLRISRRFQFVIPNRRVIPGKFVQRDPASGQYFMHAFRGSAHESAIDEVHAAGQARLDRRLGWILALQFLVFGFTTSGFEGGVDMDRAGSGIQGDTLAQIDDGYRESSSFSQHYVALDLGKKSPPAELDKAYGAIQAIVANNANPGSWLDGFKGIDGRAAKAPEKFRIEISRPEPNIVVIQSIGLHWDPPGAFAYGLARRIISAWSNSKPLEINDDYSFVRPSERFMQAYGFLDNKIHWVRPVSAADDNEGHAPPPLPNDTPVFVDKRNTEGRQNGKTWATAYSTIQEGIDAAYRRRVAGVWVAGGVYGENRSGDGALYMRPGVHVYGGFKGDESDRTQRSLEANPTTIDGAAARDGEAAFHVVVGASHATLDGFTITGGKADDESTIWAYGGGGLLVYQCDPVVANCNFVGNSAKRSGGAIFVYSGNVTFDRCTFEGNSSMDSGGAVYVGGGMAIIRRSTFKGNRAQRSGDAIQGNGGSFAAENCLFFQNGEGTSYSVIYGDEFSLFNCTLAGNGDGGPSLLDGPQSKVSITNSILWNTGRDFAGSEATITYSIISGGHAGEGNLDADPLFVDPEGGDFRLMPGSPAIDAGTTEGAPGEDLDGNPRPLGKGVDIGAYESGEQAP